MKGKYLVTTDGWFYAPNGIKYRAVWGEVEIVSDSVLGITTNRNSTNWYAKIGTESNHVIVAGCQIHYAVKCETRPNIGRVKELLYSVDNTNEVDRPTEIYITE